MGRFGSVKGQEPGNKAATIPAKADKKPQAAQAADASVIEVKPGKFTHTMHERGVVEPASTRDMLSEVEGATTIISIKPEGIHVKEGEVVAELDSAHAVIKNAQSRLLHVFL